MKKIILSLILLASVVSAQTPDPLALPLIQQAYYEYVGGCRVPDGTYGASNFGWSGGGDNAIGGGLAFDPKGNGGAGSLFISGNYRPRDGGFQGSVAEIALCDTWVNSPTPSSLSTAKVLQNFADVTAGGIANLEATMGGNQGYIKLAGIGVEGDNIYFTVFHQYDSGPVLKVSHGSHSRTLSSGALGGFDTLYSTSLLRHTAGKFANVPSAWQALLGGSMLSGIGNLSVIETTSHGPAFYSFNPSAIGGSSGTLISASRLVDYDTAHETLGPWSCRAVCKSNDVYTQATNYGGYAIVPGTRSALVWGTHAKLPCYGAGTGNPALHGTPYNSTFQYCYDPNGIGNEGAHGYPVEYQMWAYDLKEMAAVKAGTKKYWEPKPYAYWTVKLPVEQSSKIAGGMAINPTTGDLYVSQYCGEVRNGYCFPILHKFTKAGGRVVEMRERKIAQWRALEFLAFVDGRLLETQMFHGARLAE